MNEAPEAVSDSIVQAKLRYVHDDRPGITRRRRGKSFMYFDVDGRRITDEAELARIGSLAIPPAYREVWICPDPRGHIQATGRDARGRKQYRYHPRWREVRDESKYEHTIEFALALPKIRARVQEDLAGRGLLRGRVLATVVALLDDTLIRVGNTEYARENDSFGLTTLQSRHIHIEGNRFSLSFRGKSGVHHDMHLRNKKLAPILKKLRDLPGQELFQYLDEDGERHDVTSDLVNEYIAEAAGAPFTAKNFRTWAGTVACALALGEAERASSATDAKRRVTAAVKEVAARLGNTPSVCRKCYVHPAVIERYLEAHEFDVLRERAAAATEHAEGGLRPEEEAVLRFLQQLK